jgi:hypothetical protein
MKRWLFVLVLASALLVPVRGEAQVIQYFFLPVDVVGNYRGPSYLKWRFNPDGLDVPWSCKDYGSVNNIMVCAVNAEAADLTWLAAQADVYAWPTVLDENLPQAERSAVTAYLEAAFVPANWISPSDTRRTALRTVTGMFLFMQRLTALSGNSPLDWGITLNTQFRNLTTEQQTWLEEAAVSLGYAWDVVSNDTIRLILKAMADAWGDQPIYFGFTTL